MAQMPMVGLNYSTRQRSNANTVVAGIAESLTTGGSFECDLTGASLKATVELDPQSIDFQK